MNRKGEPFKKRVHAKFVKGLKDYTCLTCEKEIPKKTRAVSCTHKSAYLCEAWEELTKYKPWARHFEVFVSLRFCSGRCYRRWKRLHEQNYQEQGYPKAEELRERYMKIVLATRDRRKQGWKDWKVWKEVFNPLNDRFRV